MNTNTPNRYFTSYDVDFLNRVYQGLKEWKGGDVCGELFYIDPVFSDVYEVVEINLNWKEFPNDLVEPAAKLSNGDWVSLHNSQIQDFKIVNIRNITWSANGAY